MSDDYFSNDKDDEYWNDEYFEKHRSEYSHGSGNIGIGKLLWLLFWIVLGIMTIPDSPMMGIMIIILAIVFIGIK